MGVHGGEGEWQPKPLGQVEAEKAAAEEEDGVKQEDGPNLSSNLAKHPPSAETELQDAPPVDIGGEPAHSGTVSADRVEDALKEKVERGPTNEATAPDQEPLPATEASKEESTTNE